MSEPRKNHLTIDGGQVKEDDHVASYKPIPESDTGEFWSSKSSISKSKEKASPDGAEDKLLQKEDEAKIVTRVDMADAKYVVGDLRNGDAKIELDANKRQFSGLTKEELLKYAEDPFWVKLRWFMFVLFWVMWLCMLGGAIGIIVSAPRCVAPTPKTWFEKGPLVDLESGDYAELMDQLPLLKSSAVQGVFIEAPSYEVLDDSKLLEQFKGIVEKAKEFSIKVIVNLTPNFVSSKHPWFIQSENRSGEFTDYFTWAKGNEFDEAGQEKPPNNWVSTLNQSAWTYSQIRKEFYLHQYGADQPDLNFHNTLVLGQFNKVLETYMKAGAAGVRLNKVRQLLVNTTLANNIRNSGHGGAAAADHTSYEFWWHRSTSDQPELDSLLTSWAKLVDDSGSSPGAGETVFTMKEDGSRAELFMLERNVTLRPLSAAPAHVDHDVTALADRINARLMRAANRSAYWPAIQLTAAEDAEAELGPLALLLPAGPVLRLAQLAAPGNETTESESLSHLVALRSDASVEHGEASVVSVPAPNRTDHQLLVCARWKAGHTGYLAVFNPTAEELRANLTGVTSVPDTLTIHHISRAVKQYTNYTNNHLEMADNVLVPPKSTVVLSYVPKANAEAEN